MWPTHFLGDKTYICGTDDGPSENELESGRFHGHHIAEVTTAVLRGRAL